MATKTANTLITEAYRLTGAIGAIEVPSFIEASQGLSELNDIISILNTQELWPASFKKIQTKFESNRQEFTIGQANGTIANINNTGVGNPTVVTFNERISYAIGDQVEITDTINFNGIFTIDAVISPTSYQFSDGPASPITSESTGNVWNMPTGAADINEKRPIKLKSIRVLVGNVWYPLKYTSELDLTRTTTSENISSYPAWFTYRATYPHGTIFFNLKLINDFLYEIYYDDSTIEYEIYEVIDLPPGYYQTLKWMLAENLALYFGLDETKLAYKARGYLENIKSNNSDEMILDTSELVRGWYDYKSDQFY